MMKDVSPPEKISIVETLHEEEHATVGVEAPAEKESNVTPFTEPPGLPTPTAIPAAAGAYVAFAAASSTAPPTKEEEEAEDSDCESVRPELQSSSSDNNDFVADDSSDSESDGSRLDEEEENQRTLEIIRMAQERMQFMERLKQKAEMKAAERKRRRKEQRRKQLPKITEVPEESPPLPPPVEPPPPEQPKGPFRLDKTGKGFEKILNETCLAQETHDRHRHHGQLNTLRRMKKSKIVKTRLVNESAITNPEPNDSATLLDKSGVIKELTEDKEAPSKLLTAASHMAGAALLPEEGRFWCNHRGDVPPAPLPPKPTTHTATPTNAEVTKMITDICKGGVAAAKAGLQAACSEPEYLITLPAVPEIISRMQAQTSIERVKPGQEQHMKGADGQNVFSLRGTYKSYGGRGKPGENTCFSKDWKEKLKQEGLGHLSEHVIPRSNKANIRDSMEAHASRLQRVHPKMDSKARHAFDIASQSYPDHLPPLFEEISKTRLPKGWQRCIDNLQHKSSGWNARYRPLDKKAWATANDSMISLEFRFLVAVRLLLRSAAGPRMGIMEDEELIRLFLADPKEGFLKQEDHGETKSRAKRWRIIWNASLLDSFCQMLLSMNACKADIAKFQEPGTTTLHGLGTGHDNEGIKHFVKKVREGAKGGVVKASDATGFDFSVPRLGIVLDAERKAQTVASNPSQDPEKEPLSAEDEEAIYLAAARWFYCDAFANTCHAINYYGDVWGCDQYGMTASGVPCTGSQNAFFRGFVLLLAGALWAITVGDDESHTGDVDDSVLAEWGTVTKKGSETVGSADDFSMLSHRYVTDEHGNTHAEYLNLDKMLGTNLLMVFRGECIPEVAVAAQLNVLRDTPGAIQRYREVAAIFGGDLWSGEVDFERFGEFEDVEDRGTHVSFYPPVVRGACSDNY
jgi:hypothetical protein